MNLSRLLALVPSSLMIGIFFLIPFTLILLYSVAVPTETDYRFGFDLQHFERFFTPFYVKRALFSVGICALVAVLALIVAYPFTYMLTHFRPRTKTLWLIYILAQLSLSEVLIAFSWQILFSRRAGIGQILEFVGIVDKSFALTPSGFAVVVALIYLALPFAVLLLFPALSRIDRSQVEAARTMGATPARAFFTVVLPSTRGAIVSTTVTVFVLTLGAIIIPQVLGAPQHWTLSVLITDQAISQFNLPFASAMATSLLAITATLILVVYRFSGRGTS